MVATIRNTMHAVILAACMVICIGKESLQHSLIGAFMCTHAALIPIKSYVSKLAITCTRYIQKIKLLPCPCTGCIGYLSQRGVCNNIYTICMI